MSSRDLDAKRRAQAQQIVEAARLDTLQRAQAFACAWVMSALKATADEAFMHDSRDEARRELAETTAVLARVTRDNAQLTVHLTDAQQRGSSLMIELQAARFKLRQLYEAWPHWQCPAPCHTFNGEAKVRQEVCRACGAARPKDVP